MSKLKCDELLNAVAGTRLLTSEQLEEARRVGSMMDQSQPELLAGWMQKQGWLTPWQAKALLAGRTDFFVGKYKLIDEIHEGGLGTTYRAWQPGLGRTVVIKVMSRKLFASPESAAQLHKEVQSAALLTHPNLMYIFDAEQIGGQFFLVNEAIDGLDLSAWQKKFHPLPVSEVASCVRQAASAMQKAFEHKLIHGNLKPTNILVETDAEGRCGLVKVVNMGLGMLSRDLGELADLDSADQMVASPDYIAPEQAEDATNVDVRSDLFSLGCLMYRLLTGETPFGGRNATEKILARVKRDAPPVSKLRSDAASVDHIVAKLLARDPSDRYQTPRDLLEALDALAAAKPAAAAIAADEAPAKPVAARTSEPAAPTKPAGGAGSSSGDELNLTLADDRGSAAANAAKSSGSSLSMGKGLGDQKPIVRPAPADDDELLLAPTEGAHLLGSTVAKGPTAGPSGQTPTAREASLIPTATGPNVKPVPTNAPAARPLAPAHGGPGLAHAGPVATPAVAGTTGAAAKPAVAPAETKPDPDADLAPEARPGEVSIMRPKEGESSGPVHSVAISPNGKFALAGSDAAITLWDLKRGQAARRLPGHTGGVCAVTFAPLGRIAASSGWDGLVAIWDLQSGKKLKQLQGHTDGVSSVIFSNDGKYLLSAGRDKSLRLWDVRTGQVVVWLETTDWVRSISFTPDNRCALLAGGGDAKDYAVRLWDLSAQQELRCMLGHTGEVHRAALAAGGRGAISVSSDGSVRLWDVTTGSEVGMLFGHSTPVRDVAVTSDNRRAVTGSDDETVRVWDLAGRNEISRFQGHQGAVNAVAVSPNLKYIVTGGADATVRLWKMPD
ncbi:MAG TPA: serine/threonine-protein kinase [Pirellulales bacterium]